MNRWLTAFISLLICIGQLHADPWGKDADLVYKRSQESNNKRCQSPILGPLSELLIGFHQNVISPADGPRSHYYPSSSQYTLDAMRKYGFLRGFIMGCDRLMRENDDPWIYGTTTDGAGDLLKYNPVR